MSHSYFNRNISQPKSSSNNNYPQKKNISHNISSGYSGANKNSFLRQDKYPNNPKTKTSLIVDDISQQSSRDLIKTNQQLPNRLDGFKKKDPNEFKMSQMNSSLINRKDSTRKTPKKFLMNNYSNNYNNNSFLKSQIPSGKENLNKINKPISGNVDSIQSKVHQCFNSSYNNITNTNLRNVSPYRENKNELENGMISHSMIGNSNNNLLNHNSVGSSGSKSTIYSNSTYDKEISMRAKKNNIQFMNNNNYNEIISQNSTKLNYQQQQNQHTSSHFNFLAGIPTLCVYKTRLNRLEKKHNTSLSIGASGNGLSMAISF